MTCTASGVAQNLAADPFTGVLGNCAGVPDSRLYRNVATATGETSGGSSVEDTDASHYCNAGELSEEIFSDSFE